jgi:hypothetical protein
MLLSGIARLYAQCGQLTVTGCSSMIISSQLLQVSLIIELNGTAGAAMAGPVSIPFVAS